MANKIRLTARRKDGTEVVVYPETIAEQVICLVPDGTGGTGAGEGGEQAVKEVALDVMLNEYADEINANTQALTQHAGDLQLLVRPGYAVCDTAGDVAAKTVDITPFVLEVGVELTIKFINDNTTMAATLNVANSGAKPIMYKGLPPQGTLLTGVQKFSYDGVNWNVVGDFDTNTDTTYDILSVNEAMASSAVAPRTVNALNLNQIVSQISTNIVNASLADSFDISELQSTLNNLIFQLASQGIIEGKGLDTVVTIDSVSDIVIVSGMYADGKVYI